MNSEVLDFFICKKCKSKLKLKSFIKSKDKTKDGILYCNCGNYFPVINFMPRVICRKNVFDEYINKYKNNLKGMRNVSKVITKINQTRDSFSNKWLTQPKWGINKRVNTVISKWFYEKYGWKDEKNFKKDIQKKKNILDAGCGLGRDLLRFCKATSSAKIIGIDFSDSVRKAYENTKKFKNAAIIQSDLNKLPFYFNFFDFILAEGVLHHTINTKKSFINLVKYLKKNGEIAIYVYNKKPLIREFCDNFLRKHTTKMSSEQCWKFSRNITSLGKSLSRIKQDLILDSDIDLLNIKKGRYNLQRFFYDYILKCFWNDAFSFDENVLVNFDWYHPKLAHKHTKNEIKSWFNKNKLRIKWIYEDKSGIAARGVKI